MGLALCWVLAGFGTQLQAGLTLGEGARPTSQIFCVRWLYPNTLP